MKYLSVVFITISIFGFIANTVDAFDFYGASVNDQDAPSSYMRYGIYGFRAIIIDVILDSPAYKAGFKQGDIIISINSKAVKKTSELSTFTTDILSVLVFSRIERNTLVINRLAIETEKANRIAAERKTIIVTRQDEHNVIQPDNSPPLVFNGDFLDKKYGRTTPAELARQNKLAVESDKSFKKEMVLRDAELRRKMEAENQRRDAERQRDEAQKQARINCNTSSECGTGRVCGIVSNWSTGQCMTDAEYNRLEDRVDQANRDRRLERKLDEIESNQQDIGRKTDDIERSQRDIGRKTDDINRKLRGW